MRGEDVLVGKRNSSHGGGEWAYLGGHLEHLETFEECLIREVKEEAGIKITNLRFLCVSNIHTYAPKHYVDIGYVADWVSGEPQNLEPHRRESWEWHHVDKQPEPLFSICKNYIEAYKTGRTYFDA